MLLSEEKQADRRPDRREIEKAICYSQQNEFNEQGHWKPPWLASTEFKRQILLFLKLEGMGGIQSPALVRYLFLCTWG